MRKIITILVLILFMFAVTVGICNYIENKAIAQAILPEQIDIEEILIKGNPYKKKSGVKDNIL